jgi:hypothetical protein
MEKKIIISYEDSIYVMKHKLISSTQNFDYISAHVRNFILEHGMGFINKKYIIVHDEDDEEHHCELRTDDRIWCPSWIQKYKVKTGDWLIVVIVGKKSVFIHCPKS